MQGLHIHDLSLYATKVFSKWREVFINGVDEGLDESIKKIEGVGELDDPLLTLGATKSTLPATSKAAASKRDGKLLSTPDLVSVNTSASPEDEHEIGDTGIMHELATTGKLSGTSIISDYSS